MSLLEVVAATCLLATAIYPALQFVRDGLAISRDNETRAAVSNFCVSKLEEHLALAAANWTNGTYTGNFASEGYASLRYSVTRSDAVAAGGVVGSLMAITVTVWNDANANSLCDTGETQVTMASKISKMAVYQALGS
ncbi:MAG TPA: hypothetical protein VFE24_14820 [Pirellulales bacterium]|nr:hypothetical protein [Pirellulales bacterium]